MYLYMQSSKTQKKIKLMVSPTTHRETLKASKSPTPEKLKRSSPQREETRKAPMSTPKRYNEEFIKVLGELSDLMIRKGEPYRAVAYQKAEQTIIKFPDDITDPAKQLKGSTWYRFHNSQ